LENFATEPILAFELVAC